MNIGQLTGRHRGMKLLWEGRLYALWVLAANADAAQSHAFGPGRPSYNGIGLAGGLVGLPTYSTSVLVAPDNGEGFADDHQPLTSSSANSR